MSRTTTVYWITKYPKRTQISTLHRSLEDGDMTLCHWHIPSEKENVTVVFGEKKLPSGMESRYGKQECTQCRLSLPESEER